MCKKDEKDLFYSFLQCHKGKPKQPGKRLVDTRSLEGETYEHLQQVSPSRS